MCWPRFTAPWISCILLLSLTAGLVNHDHNAEGAGDFVCATDHLQSDSSAPAAPQGELHAAGPLHEHHCLGCHFNGKRTLSQSSRGTYTPLDASRWTAFRPPSTPRAIALLTGGSLRGPPIA